MPNIDERELCRMFSSKEFLIPTRQICDLHAKVDEWIQTNSCGGIVWGPSRAGKSSAIAYIAGALKQAYGSELPVYVYTATNHVATQKAFYERLLMALGHPDASKGTANQMRQRLVNRITMSALNTKYKLACLFVDEAYLLTVNEFQWLCDLYNELNINDIQLTVILVSTREILDVKKGFIQAGKQQIVQRLMLKEAEFHGIESLSDLYVCMNALDNNFVPQGYDEPICLSATYFPDAHRDGKTMAAFAPAFWAAMQNLRKTKHIHANYMTMKCFMDSVSYCLRKFGTDSGDNKVYEPSIVEWEASLIASGYVSSQV
ncbi:MAG: ATP-binding protein [Oscillospiraceae bacterium]|nr:ATP-binding protein [Oscillospiraceae bacterium]